MTRPLRIALGIIALALLFPRGDAATSRATTSAQALLGPFNELAASVLWIRFDLALREGSFELAYTHATRALELDPHSVAGWYTFGSHLVFDRGSLESPDEASQRRAWVRAGLDVWRRGEDAAPAPVAAELAFVQGTTLAYLALIAEDLDWPGGEASALAAAQTAFERAASHGEPRAAEFAQRIARERAE